MCMHACLHLSSIIITAPDSPNFLGLYPMAPMSDYEEQIRFINRIRNTVINATRRVICYNLPIYDDIRLEVTEYAGLTLAVRDSSILTLVQPMYDQFAIQILDDDSEFSPCMYIHVAYFIRMHTSYKTHMKKHGWVKQASESWTAVLLLALGNTHNWHTTQIVYTRCVYACMVYRW